MNGNRSDMNYWQPKKPVANHYSLPDHYQEDIAIFVIEKIHRDDTHFQRLKENYWIQTLGTLAPSGLNNYSYDDESIINKSQILHVVQQKHFRFPLITPVINISHQWRWLCIKKTYRISSKNSVLF